MAKGDRQMSNILTGPHAELRFTVTVTNPGEAPQEFEMVGTATEEQLKTLQENDHGSNPHDSGA